jgi:hypothetical protein
MHGLQTKRSQINYQILHLKFLKKKKEQCKPKTSKRREIIKIRAQNNEIETPPQEKKRKSHAKNQ